MRREESHPRGKNTCAKALRQEKPGMSKGRIGSHGTPRTRGEVGGGVISRGFRAIVEILLFIPKKGFKQESDR